MLERIESQAGLVGCATRLCLHHRDTDEETVVCGPLAQRRIEVVGRSTYLTTAPPVVHDTEELHREAVGLGAQRWRNRMCRPCLLPHTVDKLSVVLKGCVRVLSIHLQRRLKPTERTHGRACPARLIPIEHEARRRQAILHILLGARVHVAIPLLHRVGPGENEATLCERANIVQKGALQVTRNVLCHLQAKHPVRWAHSTRHQICRQVRVLNQSARDLMHVCHTVISSIHSHTRIKECTCVTAGTSTQFENAVVANNAGDGANQPNIKVVNIESSQRPAAVCRWLCAARPPAAVAHLLPVLADMPVISDMAHRTDPAV
mmetsp:Transcript_25358/g.67981  ORF Transcript_25358/g.67981 Transcript_25358/m.67981 type:complete len:319 (-) Transcript_25358:37-993(-)|eukprot:1883892-Prymnesium_polylepis.1